MTDRSGLTLNRRNLSDERYSVLGTIRLISNRQPPRAKVRRDRVGVAMRVLWRCARFSLAITAVLTLAGCLPSTGTPDRLYPIASEMDTVRNTQEQLVSQYDTFVFSSPAQAKLARNEIIAERMFAIDVEYVQYENALTREGQEVSFATLATAGALGTASTLFTPVVTKSVLSGLSTVTLGTKGHYDSEILLASSIRTIQKQMRASRNLIAAGISAKLVQSVADYPLAAALSDLEEYYDAGTLTTGVIDTSTTVGTLENNTKDIKQAVTQAPASQRAAILNNAVIGDATTPMAQPSTLTVQNPNGVTPFERTKITKVMIQDMEIVVCLKPRTGTLTDALRTAVLAHLGKPKATAINAVDAQRMVDEFNANKNKQCPP
jgi:hypothetical protein